MIHLPSLVSLTPDVRPADVSFSGTSGRFRTGAVSLGAGIFLVPTCTSRWKHLIPGAGRILPLPGVPWVKGWRASVRR